MPIRSLGSLMLGGYPIFADVVGRVGFKMGKGFSRILVRDPDTGEEVRDDENKPLVQSDFVGVRDRYSKFSVRSSILSTSKVHSDTFEGWRGARISHVLSHSALDLKPRRLTIKALQNLRRIRSGEYRKLSEIADVIDFGIDLSEDLSKQWRLVEGQDIRAIEGIVTPQFPSRAWEIIDRKQKKVYPLRRNDIVVGLVRPERRNIGLLLDDAEDIVGSPDGIAVVRVKADYEEQYSQFWLFYSLRSESSRLQLWTESGGTSYGKLTDEHIKNLLLEIPSSKKIEALHRSVQQWATSVKATYQKWNQIGSWADRFPIINSPLFGLEPVEDPWDPKGTS